MAEEESINPAIDILNRIVSGMTGQEVTGLGSIYFFLIFTLLFSLSFAATAYLPMFRKKEGEKEERFNNIRIIIALSIAFLTTISSYTIIVSQLQIFGVLAALAIGVSIGILAVVPKKHRDEASKYVMFIGILAAILIFYTFIMEIDWVTPTMDFISTSWQNFLTGQTGITVLLIIITFIIVFIIAVYTSMKKEKEK
jgi:hypothetical protein